MKTLIEPEFDGLFRVSSEYTGISVKNFQFDRYCTLLEGLTKMLKSVGYRLQIRLIKEQDEPCYILIEAVPITDYSAQIELSQDSRMNFTMDDKQNGVNHLVVTGKGKMQERNIFHLYVQKDGSIGKTQYYKGLNEISAVYENTSTETAELEKTSVEQLQKLMNTKIDQILATIDRKGNDGLPNVNIVNAFTENGYPFIKFIITANRTGQFKVSTNFYIQARWK